MHYVLSHGCVYFTICANLFRAETERMNRPATASQSLGNPERKNTPCIFVLAGVKFLLKKERVFFFRGSAQEVSGQCVGLQCGRSFCKTIFWGKDLPKLRLICF